MNHRWGIILIIALFTGCIEAGSLDIPREGGDIDIESLTSRLNDLKQTTSVGSMDVPERSLPRYFMKSGEHGIYEEAFTLEGLPSALIKWRVYRDPFEIEYNRIEESSRETVNMNIGEEGIEVLVTERDDFYRMTAHIGLYTFVAEMEDVGDFESAGPYGGRREVVGKVFEAGVEKALTYDLESLGK